MSHNLRFRQVHLDFHTSPYIPGIGVRFEKGAWQQALKSGHVDSITCFSKCHHGWSYHPTEVGKMHPGLGFNLLRAQMDASKEIDVHVPVYISAGVDNVAALEHPEWREISVDGCYQGWSGPVNKPGFMAMCFNSGYLSYLTAQIREAVTLFPEANGVFLDIIFQGECCCRSCLGYMEREGLDADNPEDRRKCAVASLERYYQETTAACRINNKNMPVFHNSGHITKGNRDILRYFSHLELESLPTGGWGYDHFPLSARYSGKLGLDFLGMTGKFHTTWGEFGGYKHPNALKYECALILASGAKCSVGDQLHPNGEMDESTYRIIGQAYAEVEKKEPWCRAAKNVADIAVLSSEAEIGKREPDIGVGRILLEGHFLFDLIDRQMDFDAYKLLIFPDAILFDDNLKTKTKNYLADGGKLLLTGTSGLDKSGHGFALDVGAEHLRQSPFQPDYLEASKELAPDFVESPLVMYIPSQQVKPTTGRELARIRKPYFNRTWRHFCSHQHAPPGELSEYAGAVANGNILYLAHPIFSIYEAFGAVAYKQYAIRAIQRLLEEEETLVTNLPSQARVTLTHQAEEKRYILHLLFATTIARGATRRVSPEGYVRDSSQVEVIEDLLPLRDILVKLRLPVKVSSVTLEPQSVTLPFKQTNEQVQFVVEEFTCHQMVIASYQ